LEQLLACNQQALFFSTRNTRSRRYAFGEKFDRFKFNLHSKIVNDFEIICEFVGYEPKQLPYLNKEQLDFTSAKQTTRPYLYKTDN